MSKTVIMITLTTLIVAGAGHVLGCEYKAGETKYLDYATCRYGKDAILVVDLPEVTGWDHCIYLQEAFRPEKLLAITRMRNGKEDLSVNDRSQIGNPCYLAMQSCGKALQEYKASH